jgi:hypothetical protein
MKKRFSFSLHWQSISLLLILGFAFLGQFSRIDTPVGRLSLHEILMLPVVGVSFWQQRGELFHKVKHSRAFQVALLFLLWAGTTTIWNSYALSIPPLFSEGIAYLARLSIYLAFAFTIQLWVSRKVITGRFLRNALLIWLLLQAIVGVAQFLLLPDTRIYFYLGWDDHLSRAFGTLFDPGFFGLLMGAGALLSYIGAVRSNTRTRTIFTCGLAVFLCALALSYSRASYVAFLAGTFMLSVLWKQRKVLLLIPLLVLCLVLLPKDGGGEGQNLLRTRSIEAREEVLEYHSQNITARELLIGRGWYYESALSLHEAALAEKNPQRQSSSQNRNNAQAVDNIYLHFLFSTGIIGTSFFVAWLGIIFWQNRFSPEFLTLWSLVLVHSLLSSALLYSWVMLMLAIFPASEQNWRV